MAKNTKARRQAKTEGQVRYGPQQRLLRQMLKDVQSQFSSGLAGEESAAQALVDSARAAQPQMQRVYHDAAGVAARALTPAAGAPDLNALGLGAGAAPYLGAAARDASATQMRLAQQLQMARGELTQRELRAGDARQFAVNKLASDTADQASKIRQQQSGLTSDQTAFVSQRLGELLKEQADRHFKASEDSKSRDVSLKTAGVNPDGSIIPGRQGGPEGEREGRQEAEGQHAGAGGEPHGARFDRPGGGSAAEADPQRPWRGGGGGACCARAAMRDQRVPGELLGGNGKQLQRWTPRRAW
jgi:hypothetical protein